MKSIIYHFLLYLQKLNIYEDGEQNIVLGGRNVTVHCHNMNTTTPREYLTLPTGEKENYSEVFGMRLMSPDTCPQNASRDSCPCVQDDSPRVGMSVWTKINLNITSLSINRNSRQCQKYV